MPSPLENIDVFILCGGLGRRLRRIDPHLPKPMVEINGRPFLDILLQYLSRFGFRRFILGVGYKADRIKNYYSKNKVPGAKILFSQEKTPLGTGGAVRKAARLIQSNPFFVVNGDSFCKFDPVDFLKFHKCKNSLISILLRKAHVDIDYGKVTIDKVWRIRSFNEKIATTKRCLINTGIYIFNKKALSMMPPATRFSLERDLFPKMSGGEIFGYPRAGFFIDIGTPKRYLKASDYLLKH